MIISHIFGLFVFETVSQQSRLAFNSLSSCLHYLKIVGMCYLDKLIAKLINAPQEKNYRAFSFMDLCVKILRDIN